MSHRTVPVRTIVPSLSLVRLPKGRKTGRAWVGREIVLDLPVLDPEASVTLPASGAVVHGGSWPGNPTLHGACTAHGHHRRAAGDGDPDRWCPARVEAPDRVASWPTLDAGVSDTATRALRSRAQAAVLGRREMKSTPGFARAGGTNVVPEDAVVVVDRLDEALDRTFEHWLSTVGSVVGGIPMLRSPSPAQVVSLPMRMHRRHVYCAIDWPDRVVHHARSNGRLITAFPLDSRGFETAAHALGPASDHARMFDALGTSVVRDALDGTVVTVDDAVREPLRSDTLGTLKREVRLDVAPGGDPFHRWAVEAENSVTGREAAVAALRDLAPPDPYAPHADLQSMVTALTVARERTLGAAWRSSATRRAVEAPGLDALGAVDFAP